MKDNTSANNNANNSNSNNNNAAQSLQLQMNGLNSMNLMQNLPDILNNLTQLVSNQNQQNNADHGNGHGNGTHNPFEPTPLNGASISGLPPLNGTVEPAPAAASLPTFDLGALFEPRPMAEKRHSLALISDFDWLKPASTSNNNGDDHQNVFDPKISAAFAA